MRNRYFLFVNVGTKHFYSVLNFTCRDGVLFGKEAQTLFQHKLGKQKTFILSLSEKYLPRINVFWTLVMDFVHT